MGNVGANEIPSFKKGQVVSARKLDQLSRLVSGRTIGGDGTVVNKIGRDTVIRHGRTSGIIAPSDRIVGVLQGPSDEDDAETGDYNFSIPTNFPGPLSGHCSNLEGLDHVPIGTRVFMQMIGGRWYFTMVGLLFRCKITDVLADYVEVATVAAGSDTVEGDPFNISKPHALRQSTWAGQTIGSVAYTAVDEQTRTGVGSETETQLIIPPYFVGDQVFATYVPNDPNATDAGVLMDVNNAGRAWAKAAEE